MFEEAKTDDEQESLSEAETEQKSLVETEYEHESLAETEYEHESLAEREDGQELLAETEERQELRAETGDRQELIEKSRDKQESSTKQENIFIKIFKKYPLIFLTYLFLYIFVSKYLCYYCEFYFMVCLSYLKPCSLLLHYLAYSQRQCFYDCIYFMPMGRFGNTFIEFFRALQLAKKASIKKIVFSSPIIEISHSFYYEDIFFEYSNNTKTCIDLDIYSFYSNGIIPRTRLDFNLNTTFLQ